MAFVPIDVKQVHAEERAIREVTLLDREFDDEVGPASASMCFSDKFRLNALLCALALILCVVASRPIAEIGINDDWSYIRTAQLLAQTGHVVYNGWATAMIGWQLLLGALFLKLFGFSFTAARMSVVLVGAATAFLTQRSFVRSGTGEWNATLATLTLVLSPLFLPLSVSFMTDLPGLFAIVVCFYSCLRALQGSSERARIGWICFAALANAVGGTARQIAWLGVMVMVPCTIWLLRRDRRVAVAGAAAVALGVAIIVGSLRWFYHQPHSVPEQIVRGHIGFGVIKYVLTQGVQGLFETVYLSLPILLMFLPAMWRGGRARKAAVVIALLICAGAAFGLHHAHRLANRGVPPFFSKDGNYVSAGGIFVPPALGTAPVVFTAPIRIALSAVVLCALIAFCDATPKTRTVSIGATHSHSFVAWRELRIVVFPYLAFYLLLLLPRAAFVRTFDRYLLGVLPFVLLLIVLRYQSCFTARLPPAALVLVVVIGLVTIAETHDLFAVYRATAAAATNLQRAGVPVTAIDAGWEYDGWTEISEAGYLITPGNFMPHYVRALDGTCPPLLGDLNPHVHPQYSISFTSNACHGRANFKPVTYTMWLPPRKVTLYIVNNPVSPTFWVKANRTVGPPDVAPASPLSQRR